jgi:hypothetical protein
VPSTITLYQISQLSLATLISNNYLKNGENKPGFGAFSITMIPKTDKKGGKGQLLSWAFFVKGTILRKVRISID